MSYVKLWSLLSSSALISANHRQTSDFRFADKESSASFVHNMAWWAEIRTYLQFIGNAQVNHFSDVKNIVLHVFD